VGRILAQHSAAMFMQACTKHIFNAPFAAVSLGLGFNVGILINLTTLNLNTGLLVLPKVCPTGVQQSQFYYIVALHYVSIYILESINLVFNFQRGCSTNCCLSAHSSQW